MRPYLKKLLVLAIVIAAIIAIRLSGVGDVLTLENLQAQGAGLQKAVSSNYVFAAALYVVLYIAVVALSVPGATIMTLAGGFLFGTILGALYVNFAATLGAILVFLFARYLFGKSLQKKYAKRLAKFNREFKENGVSYLLMLRFIPIFPFFLINIFAGLTNISLFTFAWTTMLGIIPGSLVYTFAGAQLSTISSVGDIFSPNMLFSFVLLGLFALVPVVHKRWKRRA